MSTAACERSASPSANSKSTVASDATGWPPRMPASNRIWNAARRTVGSKPGCIAPVTVTDPESIAPDAETIT